MTIQRHKIKALELSQSLACGAIYVVNVKLTFRMKRMIIQMTDIEQYFPVVLFIML